MPNWVYNEVEIAAPLSEVQAYLFETDDLESTSGGRTHVFNLHKLFPERFQADDQRGLTAWDYDWMVENTGTKWNPRIDSIGEEEGVTTLAFETAWCAITGLLERWHQTTGWKIVNRHDEESPEHDAVFTCENGTCHQELHEGSDTCSQCEDRFASEELDDYYGECPRCFATRGNYLVTVEADWPASINIDERNKADVYGDVVLGIVSAHSKEQAIQFMLHRIPEEARQDTGWIDCPSEFGLAAFKLHTEDREEG